VAGGDNDQRCAEKKPEIGWLTARSPAIGPKEGREVLHKRTAGGRGPAQAALPMTCSIDDILVAPFYPFAAEQELGTCVARVWSNDVAGKTDCALASIHRTTGLTAREEGSTCSRRVMWMIRPPWPSGHSSAAHRGEEARGAERRRFLGTGRRFLPKVGHM
jgi:hypothetical protein